MNSEAEARDFHFLDDSATKDDEFNSHDLAAKSMARQIESDPKGKTIGLEGAWGSGKSSVIKMLNKHWESREHVRVFTFNAWAHEGDSLRRSFLEELVTDAQPRKDGKVDPDKPPPWLEKRPVDCEKWPGKCFKCPDRNGKCRPDIIRDALRHRREHNEITTEPHITKLGIGFALLSLVMPIGVALLAATDLMGWWCLWFVPVAAAPLLLLLVTMACRCKKWRKGEQALLELGEFFGKSRDTTSHTMHRGVEPTSIEFGEYYEDILHLMFPEKLPKRRLVIVLDNLDRVEPVVAKKAWGTMRTFLRPDHGKKDSLRDHVWLIVPYEPEGISRLWQNRDGSPSGEGAEKSVDQKRKPGETGKDSRIEEEDLARAFKEKAFQVRYRVAPPLVSRWQKFFKKHLQDAINEEPSSAVLHYVYQIFRIMALPQYRRGTPTPREMIVFINRVVAIAQQHPGVSVPEATLYASLELEDARQAIKKLEKGEFDLPESLKDLLGNDWPDGIAAIHFGVARGDAAEALYRPRIQGILKNGDKEDLKKLCGEPGGPEVFENYVRDETGGFGFTEVLQAAGALGAMTPETPPSHITIAGASLAGHLLAVTGPPWKPRGQLTQANAQHVVRLMQFNPALRPHVQTQFNLTIKSDEQAETLPDALKEWILAVIPIVSELTKAGLAGPTIHLPDAQSYLALLEVLAQDATGEGLIRFFQPAKAVKNAYRDHILNQVRNGNIRKQDHPVLAGLLDMPCWEPPDIAAQVAAAVSAAIQHANASPDTLVHGCRFLFTRRNDPRFKEPFAPSIDALGKSPELCMALEKYKAKPGTAAWPMALLFLYNPQPAFPDNEPGGQGKLAFNTFLDGSDEGLTDTLAGICINHGIGAGLLRTVAAQNYHEKPLVVSLVRQLVAKDVKAKVLTPDLFLELHSFLRKALETTPETEDESPYETLVRRLLPDGLLAKMTRSLNLELMHACHIALSQTEDAGESEGLVQTARQSLGALDQSVWQDQLQNDGWALRVLLLLEDKNKLPSLDHRYSRALTERMKAIRDDAKAPGSLFRKETRVLLGCVPEHEKQAFRQRLIEDVVDNGRKVLTNLLPICRQELDVAFAQLLGDADDRTKKRIRIALGFLAEHEDAEHKRWVIAILGANLETIGLTDEDKQRLAGDKLLGDILRVTPASEADENTMRVARAIGVDLKEDVAEEESPEEDEAADEGTPPADESDGTPEETPQ